MSVSASQPARPSRPIRTAPPDLACRIIQQGLELHESGRASGEVLHDVVHAYVGMGLYGPARELLREIGDEADSDLAAQLAKRPSGRLAFGALEAAFEEGVRAIARGQPHLAGLIPELRTALTSCEIYRSNDGQLHLAQRTEGRLGWIGGFQDTRQLAAGLQLSHKPEDQFCENYLVTGDRFGAALRRLHESTSTMFMTFTPRLFVLEPDLRPFAAALTTRDMHERVADERVHVFLGGNMLEQLRAFLRANPDIKIPTSLVLLPPQSEETTRRFTSEIESLLAEQTRRTSALALENDAAYDRIDAAEWGRRFSSTSTRPLRILGITSRFTTVLQYATRDVRAAFERLGHQFDTLIEPTDHDMLSAESFVRRVADHRPDLLFIIDHHRAEYPGLLPRNLPCICWIQDLLPNLTTREAGRNIGPLDFYLAGSICELASAYDYPTSRGFVATPVTDETVYAASPLPDAERAPHQCDFSFVSNQSTTPEEFHRNFRANLPADSALLTLCDGVFESLRSELMQADCLAYPRRATDVLAEASAATGVHFRAADLSDRLALQFVQPLGELMFRQSALAWVAEYCEARGRSLRLYGNGWDRHPLLGRFACGVAPNGRSLRAIYQATAINLQIIGSGAIHPRLLDGLAAGGFFLIRKTGLDLAAAPPAGRMIDAPAIDWSKSSSLRLGDSPECQRLFEIERTLAGGRQPLESIELDRVRFEQCRELAQDGLKRVARAALPSYDAVAFGTRDEFFQLADRYLADAAAREFLASGMRRAVLNGYTYTALVRDLLAFLGNRLAPMTS